MKTFQRLLAAGLLLGLPVAAHAEGGRPIEIVVLGDSLSAGYGLPSGSGFPETLQRKLRQRGFENVTIIGAGVSGDTAQGGLSRFEWSVPADAEGVIVELGANDALRGVDPARTRASLSQIVAMAQARGQKVLLAGMMAPPNMGEAYGQAFNPIYSDIAVENGVLLYPFFLDGVAGDPAYNLADGMHPNAEGVERIADGILPQVERLIAAIRAEDPVPAAVTD